MFYYCQQLGGSKKPYLAQYSVVLAEELPKNISNNIITNSIATKIILKPIKKFEYLNH